jgi:hypothetical protein
MAILARSAPDEAQFITAPCGLERSVPGTADHYGIGINDLPGNQQTTGKVLDPSSRFGQLWAFEKQFLGH